MGRLFAALLADSENPPPANPANPANLSPVPAPIFADSQESHGPQKKTETADANGWRSTEALAIAAWHRDWRPVWQSWRKCLAANPGWQAPPEAESRRRIAELVAIWNRCTGQHRDPEDVCQHLAAIDYTDRELMTHGALALVVWSCLAHEVRP